MNVNDKVFRKNNNLIDVRGQIMCNRLYSIGTTKVFWHQGPDHVQLSKVNWRLKVNWKIF